MDRTEKELHQAAREVVAEDVVAEEVKRHLFPVLQQSEETLGENERGQPLVVVVANQFAQQRPSDLRPGAFRRGEIVSRNQVVDIVDTEQQGVGVLRQIVVAALPLRVGFPPLRDIAVKQFLGVFFQVPEKQRKELSNPQRRAGAEQHQVEVQLSISARWSADAFTEFSGSCMPKSSATVSSRVVSQ